jgi:hypothetical protein
MDKKLSEHFNYSEFRCPCGKCPDIEVDHSLIAGLEKLRICNHQPIYIASGLRCKKYNDSIGGYDTSEHLYGLAADIYNETLKPFYLKIKKINHSALIELITLAETALKVGIRRIGLYPFSMFLHLDMAKPSPSVSWIRQKNGFYYYYKTLEEAIEVIETMMLSDYPEKFS